jgi:hypothetical protein
MCFRKVFARILRGSTHGDLAPAPTGQTLGETDVLSRYLFYSKEFSREKNIVKRHAFMPTVPQLETSCFRTTGMAPQEIVDHADEHVVPHRGKTPYGWAEIYVRNVLDVGLNTDYNNIPPLHVNILGWPPDKDRQMAAAQLLAAEATLRLITSA